jgi:hypothetical protein
MQGLSGHPTKSLLCTSKAMPTEQFIFIKNCRDFFKINLTTKRKAPKRDR